MGAIQQFLSHIPKTKTQSHLITSAVARALIGRGRGREGGRRKGGGRVYIHILVLCPTNFF